MKKTIALLLSLITLTTSACWFGIPGWGETPLAPFYSYIGRINATQLVTPQHYVLEGAGTEAVNGRYFLYGRGGVIGPEWKWALFESAGEYQPLMSRLPLSTSVVYKHEFREYYLVGTGPINSSAFKLSTNPVDFGLNDANVVYYGEAEWYDTQTETLYPGSFWGVAPLGSLPLPVFATPASATGTAPFAVSLPATLHLAFWRPGDGSDSVLGGTPRILPDIAILQYKKLPDGEWIDYIILENLSWPVNFTTLIPLFGRNTFDPPGIVAGDNLLIRVYMAAGWVESFDPETDDGVKVPITITANRRPQ